MWGRKPLQGGASSIRDVPRRRNPLEAFNQSNLTPDLMWTLTLTLTLGLTQRSLSLRPQVNGTSNGPVPSATAMLVGAPVASQGLGSGSAGPGTSFGSGSRGSPAGPYPTLTPTLTLGLAPWVTGQVSHLPRPLAIDLCRRPEPPPPDHPRCHRQLLPRGLEVPW